MKKFSFIHAADLHLDSPMVGLKSLPEPIFKRIKESTFTALKRLTAAAIEQQVDFVILAGDLYDGEDRSLRAQSRFRAEMLKLKEKGIPVYVIHGNHDHLNGTWVDLEMPVNVHVFGTEVETKVLHTKNGTVVGLYGFSYPTRNVFERKIDDYRKLDGADFHIGILHGNESSGSEHDNYAPFSVKDLQEKDFDYWALGHIHKRTILSEDPPIIYPGNIQGRSRKETGIKGFYHVSLNEIEAKPSFIESSDIVWREAEIDAASAGTFHEAVQLCREVMNQIRDEGKGTLLTIHLKNMELDDYLEKNSLKDNLLELLVEDEQEEDSFVWVVELYISERKMLDKEQLKTEASFYGELFQTIEHYENFDRAMSPLYGHSLGRKYAAKLSKEEELELINQAEKLLLDLLNK
ncbi:metallophosphoesterase family protein [Neobacillus kokaensis]|uniref:DNA repair exonuclease n=1 Tax=Neobacillus kokaensis TaxID=2759023 RepID=A0ABQ3N398_9BACI|nr:DNA repair exonuclease [Neobacillus kokaensis]GHH98556.1 DNA repair exonuclease [Neobacillus kokaensis]